MNRIFTPIAAVLSLAIVSALLIHGGTTALFGPPAPIDLESWPLGVAP